MACSISTRVRFLLRGLLCTGVLATTVAACSDPSPANPKIWVSSTLGPGSEDVNNGAACQLANGPWVNIGTISDTDHTTRVSVDNGDAHVSVSCSVQHDGDGFKVSANTVVQGVGSFTIFGHFTETGVQSKIKGIFVRNDTATFQQDDCTVDYSSNKLMGVAQGRVWGVITCPHATSDSSSPPRVCNGVAEFRFENCSQ